MDVVQKNAGNEIDAKAHEYMRTHSTKDYRWACGEVLRNNPALAREYAYGRAALRSKQYQAEELTPAERAMAELQADSAKTKKLASELLDHLARRKLVNRQSVPNPREAYRQALLEVQREFPNLGRAAQDGFIASDDWKLLGILIPAIKGEIEQGRYNDHISRCRCGRGGCRCENSIVCRARKLARERGVIENDVRSFAACIRDAQERRNELDELICYFE